VEFKSAVLRFEAIVVGKCTENSSGCRPFWHGWQPSWHEWPSDWLGFYCKFREC